MSYPLLLDNFRDCTAKLIDDEIGRQIDKFGPLQFRQLPLSELLTILVEEIGELAECILKHEDISEELLHISAVAVHWLDAHT